MIFLYDIEAIGPDGSIRSINGTIFQISESTIGGWSIEDNTIIQNTLKENVHMLFGEKSWKDYEITLQAKKIGGDEGFQVVFRANDGNFYWVNVGGYSNTRHTIEKTTQGVLSIFNNLDVPGYVDTDVWYDIKICCEGNHFQVWLDDVSLFDFTDENAHMSGQVGIGTWTTMAAYRNIVVKSFPSGDTIYNQLPDIRQKSQLGSQ